MGITSFYFEETFIGSLAILSILTQALPLEPMHASGPVMALTLNKALLGTSLVVQWVRLRTPNAGGLGLIPGWGARSLMHAPTKKPVCCNYEPVCHN